MENKQNLAQELKTARQEVKKHITPKHTKKKTISPRRRRLELSLLIIILFALLGALASLFFIFAGRTIFERDIVESEPSLPTGQAGAPLYAR